MRKAEKMKAGVVIGLLILAGIAAEYGIAEYFFRRTVLRSRAKRERTKKMSGTDWDGYVPGIRAAKEWLAGQEQEEVSVTSEDGLRLHGVYVPEKGSKKVALCCHGYTSEGLNDYSRLAKFYKEQGCHLLIPDARAHGRSEGTYVGFGCPDRRDVMLWIQYIIDRLGPDCSILLHGNSMGAATVLMSTGLALPSQVKVAVSDCAFTSAKEVFTHVLKTTYHLPAFPLMQITDRLARKRAGYGLDECNARREVVKAQIPILFIHGEKDHFVPCSMVYELYDACQTPKDLLVIPGASHAEAYYKDSESYEKAVRTFALSRL